MRPLGCDFFHLPTHPPPTLLFSTAPEAKHLYLPQDSAQLKVRKAYNAGAHEPGTIRSR